MTTGPCCSLLAALAAPRTARPAPRAGRGGFTLIELLAAIAIVGALSALVLGAGRRASEAGKVARARAELAALAAALEGYRRQHGDYPQTGAVANEPEAAASANDGPGVLFNSLAGKRGPQAVRVALDERGFAEFARFTLQDPQALPERGTTASLANAVLDPWGRRYLYAYATGWTTSGYVLWSAGPDGLTGAPADSGRLEATAMANRDNLFAQP